MQLILLLLPVIAADPTVLQFFNLINAKPTNCSSFQSFTVDGNPIKPKCASSQSGMWIFANYTTENTTFTSMFSLNSVQYNFTFTLENVYNIPVTSDEVITTTKTLTSTTSTTSTTPTTPTKPATTKNKSLSAHFSSGPDAKKGLTISVTYVRTREKDIVNRNTAAVVVAVIEGLILGAIIIFVIYRSKRRVSDMYPPHFPPEYPNTSIRSTVYYDNAGSLSYIDRPRGYYGENRQPIPTFGTGRPITNNAPQLPIRMESMQPTPTRVQHDTPTLIPVLPERPNISLNEINQKATRDPLNDL